MSARLLRSLAVVAALLILGMAIAGALLRLFGPATPQPFNIGSPIDFIAEAAAASTYAVVGVVLARRLPRHPVSWIFLGIGVAFAVVIVTWAYAVVALSVTPELPGARLGALVSTAFMQPIGLALLVALLVLFPDGRPIDGASRRILRLVPLTAALVTVGVCLTPGDIGIFTGLENPLRAGAPPIVGRLVTVAGMVASVLLAAAACGTLLRRYRAADNVQREQIRWFVWAGGVAVALAGGVLVLLAVVPEILNSTAEAIVIVLFSIGGALVPIACAIAIRRYHLYDIDRLISQTFVYGCLLAFVAGVYTALITTLEQVSVALTGQGSNVAVVLTSVIIAASLEPLKKRLEGYAERFRDAAEPIRVAVPVPDDAWIEAVANRVAEILRADGKRDV
jgi:hypothetical protein